MVHHPLPGPPDPDGPPNGPPPPPGPFDPLAVPVGFVLDERYRGVVKEADEVRLLPFPEGGHWRSRRANTIHAVVSAAGRQDDMGQEWIMRVESDEPWLLENPGDGWASLDR